jgi:hypothetical protein
MQQVTRRGSKRQVWRWLLDLRASLWRYRKLLVYHQACVLKSSILLDTLFRCLPAVAANTCLQIQVTQK